MIDPLSSSFMSLVASGLATFGIDFAATIVHDKLSDFFKNRNLSNYDLLNCLRHAYDEALDSIWEGFSRAKTDRYKAERCMAYLRECKDEVFPLAAKEMESRPFTDVEIRHLIASANGKKERKRIMGIISPILEKCGAPETFRKSIENTEAGLCSRIIFYFKEIGIKRDEKVRGILFFEILDTLDCKQGQILAKLQEIAICLKKANLPAWVDLDDKFKHLEETISVEEGKTREIVTKKADEIKHELARLTIEMRKKGDLITSRYRLHAPLSDFSIKSQLDFDKKNWCVSMFFRTMGPIAVDFKDNRVGLRNDIVPQLISALKERNLVIAGEPASGKSVLLRWIGYCLYLEGNASVYYIPLKQGGQPQVDEIKGLQEVGYVLIDDGHLNPDFVREILFPPLENVRILVATRSQKKPLGIESFLPDGLKDWQKEAIIIESIDAIDIIIQTFASHPDNNLSIPEDIRIQMKREYGENLWFLSWVLETYKDKASLREEDILAKVKQWLVQDYQPSLKSEDRNKVKDFARIILLLSAFYQYEICVERGFATRFLAGVSGSSEKEIDAQIEILLRNCAIAGDQTFIALHHIRLAIMFLEAANRFPKERPYGDILAHIQPQRLFSSYIKELPQNSCELILHFPWYTDEGESLIDYLAAENEEDILESIRWEEDVLKIGVCIWNIASANREVARKIVEADAFDKEGLIQKLNEEKDLEEIGWCLRCIASASREVVMKLIPVVADKLKVEEDVEKIVKCVRSIAEASEEVAMRLVPVVADKLTKENDVEKVGRYVIAMVGSSEEVARKIVEADAFDKGGLIQKLNEEKDVEKIESCLSCITIACKDIANQIVEADAFDKVGLIQKLNEEKDVEKIGWCVRSIVEVSEEVAMRLVPVVADKLTKENDVGKVGRFASAMVGSSEEVARKIVEADAFDKEGLIQKLNEEKDMRKIGWCVLQIALLSKEVARKIVEADAFDKVGLIQKLNEEKDVEKITWCVHDITCFNREVARKIVEADAFDKEGLIQKLNEEKDMRKIGWCVWSIASCSQDIANQIVKGLRPEALAFVQTEYPSLFGG